MGKRKWKSEQTWGIGCVGECIEFDDSNRQEVKSMVQMGMWEYIVKGVCRNSVMIEKFKNQKLKTIRKKNLMSS